MVVGMVPDSASVDLFHDSVSVDSVVASAYSTDGGRAVNGSRVATECVWWDADVLRLLLKFGGWVRAGSWEWIHGDIMSRHGCAAR